MATTSRKVLRMTFETAGGSTMTITLPEPREDVTAQEIENVMDLVISRDIFTVSGGSLTAKRDIKIVDTNTTDLYDPPTA